MALAPWPCWSIAASPSASASAVQAFLTSFEPFVDRFNSSEAREKEDVDFVVDYFKHRREDVLDWLGTVKWEEGLRKVERKVVEETLRWVASVPSSF